MDLQSKAPGMLVIQSGQHVHPHIQSRTYPPLALRSERLRWASISLCALFNLAATSLTASLGLPPRLRPSLLSLNSASASSSRIPSRLTSGVPGHGFPGATRPARDMKL